MEVDPTANSTITPTRRIPLALKSQLKKELDSYIDLGVLEPVEAPTPWGRSLVVATKKSGALGICIDPKPLNQALKRETFQLPVLDEILPELA